MRCSSPETESADAAPMPPPGSGTPTLHTVECLMSDPGAVAEDQSLRRKISSSP